MTKPNKDSITVNGETYYIGDEYEFSDDLFKKSYLGKLAGYVPTDTDKWYTDTDEWYKHIRPIQQKELSAEDLYRVCVGRYELSVGNYYSQVIGRYIHKDVLIIGNKECLASEVVSFRPIGSQDEWRPISEIRKYTEESH